MDQTIHEGEALVKSVRPVSRNDGNLLAVTFHYPFTPENMAILGSLFDKEVSISVAPKQLELEIGDEPLAKA